MGMIYVVSGNERWGIGEGLLRLIVGEKPPTKARPISKFVSSRNSAAWGIQPDYNA